MFSKAYRALVTNTGTEKEFVLKLINTITGLSNRITCSGSVSQYDSSDTSTQPTFTFLVDNNPVLRLKRANPLSANSQNLLVTLYAGDVVLRLDEECYFSYSSYSKDAITTRTYNLSWIISDDLIFLNLGASFEHYGWKEYTTIILKGENSLYCAGHGRTSGSIISEDSLFNISNNPDNSTFIYYDVNSVINGGLKSNFSYKAAPGYINYIRGSVCVSGTTEVFNIPGIYDCTTVTLGDTVSLDDGVYYAVGPHQLVKVD